MGTKSKIYFYDKPLERKKSHKVLGITVQHNLNFDEHYENMKAKLTTANFTLVKYFKEDKFLSTQAKINFGKALVRARINYGLLLFLNAKRLEELEKINNQIMRNVLNLNNETNLDVLRILTRWPTITEDLTIKMITSYKRYTNFRLDHGIQKFIQGKSLKQFWYEFTPFTKWLYNKMENKIQEGILILNVKDIIHVMKGNFYNKRMDINENDSQNTINLKNFALTKQFDYFRNAIKKFTAQEATILVKIIINQDIFKVNIKYRMDKFKIPNTINTSCPCGNPNETLIHRIFECQQSRIFTKKLRDFITKRDSEVKQPIDLLLRSNSTKNTIFICQQLLLLLKKLRKIKICLSF